MDVVMDDIHGDGWCKGGAGGTWFTVMTSKESWWKKRRRRKRNNKKKKKMKKRKRWRGGRRLPPNPTSVPEICPGLFVRPIKLFYKSEWNSRGLQRTVGVKIKGLSKCSSPFFMILSWMNTEWRLRPAQLSTGYSLSAVISWLMTQCLGLIQAPSPLPDWMKCHSSILTLTQVWVELEQIMSRR